MFEGSKMHFTLMIKKEQFPLYGIMKAILVG